MIENVVGAKVQFNKLSINGVNYSAENLEYFNIKESLTYPGITGTISFRDWDDQKERNFMFPGQEIVVEAVLKDWKLNLPNNRYVITASYGDDSDPSQQYKIFNLNFESIFSVNAFTKKISKMWKGKSIDQIVTELIIQCHPEKENGIGIIIPTKGKMDRFYSPRWSITDTFKYLTQFATDENGHGGYCIWMDITTGKINFAPINYLYHNSGDKSTTNEYANLGDIKYTGYNNDDKNLLKGDPKITTDKTILTRNTNSLYNNRRIENIEIEQSFDIMKYVDSGANHTGLAYFDYDYYRHGIVEERANTFKMNSLANATYPMLPKFVGAKITKQLDGKTKPENKDDMDSNTSDFTDSVYRQTKACTYYPNTDVLMENTTSYQSNELVKGRLDTRMTNLLCDMVKLNISTNGDPLTKKVGRKVIVEVPSTDQRGEGLNNQLSGVYVVRNNSHSIIGGYYMNYITVMADGLKKKPITQTKAEGALERDTPTPDSNKVIEELKSASSTRA